MDDVLLRAVLTLSTVVLLCFVALYVVRKYLVQPNKKQLVAMEVVGRLSLTPRNTLYIVKVGTRHLLVGMTPQSLTTIAELKEDELTYLSQEGITGQTPSTFQDFLQSYLPKK
jgi:flagellar biosynthetic protein FliO